MATRFKTRPKLPRLTGPPDYRGALRAETSSKAAAAAPISPQAREKARQQAEMDRRKFELSNIQNDNKMFKEGMTNYKMLQELEQLTADIEAQQPVEQQEPPLPSMEEELANMTPEEAISIDPDSEDFKQLLVMGGEKAIKQLAEKRREWARNQTRETGLYNQGSTKLFEETFSPEQLERRNLALSRGTRSPEAIEHLQFLRNAAQMESAYNAGYRPPVMPPQEPYTLKEGDLRVGPYGQFTRNPQPVEQQEPFTLKPGETRYGQYGERVAGVPEPPEKMTLNQQDISRQKTLDREQRAKIASGKVVKPTKDEIDYWTDRGYTRQEGRDNARLAAEIGAGITPRKSTRTHYDNMTNVEKLKYLQTLKTSAEGQYYGADPEIEIRSPRVLEWVNKELAKLPMLSEPQADTNERVRVIGPDGQTGTIPLSQLEEALKAGYEVVEDDY